MCESPRGYLSHARDKDERFLRSTKPARIYLLSSLFESFLLSQTFETIMDATTIYQVVKKHYSSAARTTSASYANSVARAFGYTDEELAVIPEGANLGMSCGNPIALGSISTGETVIDLGSGAGFDAFLAAPMVGPSGKVIGVDMNEVFCTDQRRTPVSDSGQDMLAKARENKNKTGASNVDFIKSKITEIALPDAIADCVISNCVINLVPETEKYRVFNEIARLLKPGGRVAISDILARKAFPETYKKDIALLCGCISGASLKRDYERYLAQAGFTGKPLQAI